MNKLIPIILALMIMPFAFADSYYKAYPATTASPAVAAQAGMAQGVAYRTAPLYTPRTIGVSRDARFLPPVSEEQLTLDENGVVTLADGNPHVYGTSGGGFAAGHNPWKARFYRQVTPYLSLNEQGFKTVVVETTKYKDYGGRHLLSDYLGYRPAKQYLKGWGGHGIGTYIKPGITNMLANQPQYQQPGLPAQVVPGQ